MRNSFLKIGLISMSFLLIISCSKENISDLSDTFYVRHKGADMPAHIFGNGSEKVFMIILHGGPGGSGMTYREGSIKNRIEQSCAVVYFDQRGSGMSQGRYSKDDLNIDVMAEDVLALVKVIQHKYGKDSRFFLMGHSWGGTLGTATLLEGENQHLFKGWIDVDGAHDWKQEYFEYIAHFKVISKEQIEANNNVGFWTDVLNKATNVDQTKPNLKDFGILNKAAHESEGKLSDDGVIFEPDSGVSNFLFKNNLLTTWWSGLNIKVVIMNEQIFDNWSFEDRLGEISIPSLFLWGKYDMIVPPKMGQNAFEKIGSENKKIVVFEKSGHSPMFQESEKFADEVIAFINENK